MKKMIFTAALVLASTAAMAQKSNFQVKVDLKNFSTDSVIVYKGRSEKMDTILVKNGKFTYSANLEKASNRVFLTPKTYRGLEQKMFNFPCVPGEKAEIKGDFTTRFDVAGSKFYQQYREVDLMMESAEKDLKEFTESLNTRMKKVRTVKPSWQNTRRRCLLWRRPEMRRSSLSLSRTLTTRDVPLFSTR